MKVITNIGKIDLIKFNLVVALRDKSTYIVVLVISVLIFFIALFNNGFPGDLEKILMLGWAAMIIAVAGMLLGAVFALMIMLLTPKKSNGILGKHEYAISEEGLYEKTIVNEGVIKWEGIQEIKIINSYLYFRISGYLFHIIPKRSFASEKLFMEFAEASLSYWKKAYDI